jgi:4-hydroxybenzoate polyprenyltransferase
LGFDTVYAMSDRQDDRRVGVKSSALFFGQYAAGAVGVFFALTAGLLAYLSVFSHLHWSFWLAWSLAVAGWVGQYVRLAQPEPPPSVYGEIFRQNVWLGFILLVGMVSGSLL